MELRWLRHAESIAAFARKNVSAPFNVLQRMLKHFKCVQMQCNTAVVEIDLKTQFDTYNRE